MLYWGGGAWNHFVIDKEIIFRIYLWQPVGAAVTLYAHASLGG